MFDLILSPFPPSLLLLLQYKYQINIDGTVAAYRFPYLMGGGSLILKQDSQYYEHFYRHLRPWVHYVPVKRDLSDIVERLQWALDHDDEVLYLAASRLAGPRKTHVPTHKAAHKP